MFGARVRRKEDARLLTGRGRYVSDVELPRMLHVAFVRSVHAHARHPRPSRRAGAAAAPGVVAVVTGADPGIARHRLRALSALPTYVETEQPILAWPTVRFAGEAVAAVVARDRYAAEDAAALVEVDYEPLPAVVDVIRARGDRAVVHDAAPDNVLLSRRFDNGDVDAALAGAAVVVERAFRTNRQTAAPLEGRGGVADWNPAEGKLTLWSGTQVPHLARHGLAGILGLAENRVRVDRARRGRRVRGQGDPLSRGRRALPARDASRPSRQVGGAAPGRAPGVGARARSPLRGAGRLRSRAAACSRWTCASRAMPAPTPCTRGRRGSRRSWPAASWPGPTSSTHYRCEVAAVATQHGPGRPLPRRRAAGHHLRDGAGPGPRRARARARSGGDPAHQPGRSRRPALHRGHSPRPRQPELSGVLREGGRGHRLWRVPGRTGAPSTAGPLRGHRLRRTTTS